MADVLSAILATHNVDAALNAAGKVISSALNGLATTDDLVKVLKKQRREAVKSHLEANSGSNQLQHAVVTSIASRVLHLGPGHVATVANGKVFVHTSQSDVMKSRDFSILESAEIRNGPVGVFEPSLRQFLPYHKGNDALKSNLIMQASSIVSRPRTPNPRSRSTERVASSIVDDIRTWGHAIRVKPSLQTSDDTDVFSHKIIAVINPLSAEAQMAAPVLQFLAKNTQTDLTVVLNPQRKMSELPLKRFFRFMVQPKLEFTANGALQETSKITFTNLPAAPLLTLTLHTPSSWMAQPVSSAHDLDNIHLESAKSGVRATFELRHILVEGSCFNARSFRPAAGVQLQLGAVHGPITHDTIVMSNLGYFQLKSIPGAWNLLLRPGRSTSVFEFDRVTGADVTGGGSSVQQPIVVVKSFLGKFVQLYVRPLPGKENVRLLDINDDVVEGAAATVAPSPPAASGFWSRVAGMFGGVEAPPAANIAKAVEQVARSGDTINIFSLASGHLYERFLKIMMLSVLKHTSHPVKFWFLENCMSPRFKTFLPLFANKHGFEFELVQYNWPSWLNKQTEKHRTIWAYKILFLDVLFPLNVKKIIFVDADQVVRADLQELVDLDLEGAPYGYTPFCDSRGEMDGFRFWKSGYWYNHLAGRKYHISALYVIDLVRFRQMAAGDQLREQYQMLSQDPNSLSNLDQDLPNYMIHQVCELHFCCFDVFIICDSQVPIKSLPQEWLWCESWCSDASKSYAKTIDLCNNPKTKEPKLHAASRYAEYLWKCFIQSPISMQHCGRVERP